MHYGHEHKCGMGLSYNQKLQWRHVLETEEQVRSYLPIFMGLSVLIFQQDVNDKQEPDQSENDELMDGLEDQVKEKLFIDDAKMEDSIRTENDLDG